MKLTRIIERFKDWEARRSRHMLPGAPIRAELFGAQAGFLLWIGTDLRNFAFITLQPAAWLLAAVFCERKAAPLSRMALFARTALFVGVVEMITLTPLRYAFPQYGGAMVLAIVLSGLLISRKYVFAWTLASCVVHLSLSDLPGWSWTTWAGWCVVYITAGWLVTLFAKHLERLAEANRLAEEQQRSAIVAERTRFARDIHDTLAQGFTGIMMQLNAAEQRLGTNSYEVRTHLQHARRLASESLEEARRSVSALRRANLTSGGLLDAIGQIGQKLTSDSGIALETKLEGQPYALTEQCEANLLRIAQEALTNAVRHAHPSQIHVLLAYRTGAVVLEVGDSGSGMTGSESSGFGIDGMKQRARQLGGEIKILSDPGHGTRIVVTVPNA
jgi:signal transduction histidine kinase